MSIAPGLTGVGDLRLSARSLERRPCLGRLLARIRPRSGSRSHGEGKKSVQSAKSGGGMTTISRCREADLPRLVAFDKAMSVELGLPQDDPRATYDTAWFQECLRGRFVRDNHQVKSAVTLVARAEEAVVAGLLFYLDEAALRPTKGRRGHRIREEFVEVFWMYVDPGHRKGGVGARLVAGMVDHVRAQLPRVRRLRLHCLTSNTAGQAFWQRMGFAALRTVRAYPMEGFDSLRMECLLEPGAAARDNLPPALVIAGVAGAGKSSVAKALARMLDREFIDADDYHSPQNVAKMRRGNPLDDADRRAWLEKLHAVLAERVGAAAKKRKRQAHVVLACSALKHTYRQALRGDLADAVAFVLLSVPQRIIEGRLAERPGHFMPASLAKSQFDALEPLTGADQPCLLVEVPSMEERSVEGLAEWIRTHDTWRRWRDGDGS